MATVSVLGCAGYAGQETLDRVLAHPELEPLALGSDSLAGRPAAALDPRLVSAGLPDFVTVEEALEAGADVLFLCLGTERSAALDLPPDATVVDLSGAHRLRDSALYERWYGFSHPRPETLPGARAGPCDPRGGARLNPTGLSSQAIGAIPHASRRSSYRATP